MTVNMTRASPIQEQFPSDVEVGSCMRSQASGSALEDNRIGSYTLVLGEHSRVAT